VPIYRFLIFEGSGNEVSGRFRPCYDDDEACAHAATLLAQHRRRISVEIWCDKRRVAVVSKSS